MVRPGRFLAALIALAGLLVPGAGHATPVDAEVRFGAALGPRPGETRMETLADIEREVGQRVRLIRSYEKWDSSFPTPLEAGAASRGQTILLSVVAKSADGSPIPWAEIADATPGTARHDEIVAWAHRIADFADPILFTFNHEPETVHNLDKGEAADFVAAWRRVVDVFRAEGVDNAEFLWIATDHSFSVPATDRRHAERWYPGDAWVDHLGMDVYNWYDCRRAEVIDWRSPATLLADFVAFGAAHPDKGLWLPEFGSAEDPQDPTRKAQWTTELFDLLRQPGYEAFEGVLVFHSQPQQVNSDCEWWVDSSPATRDAFRAALADPFYGGTTPPAPPPPDTRVVLVVADPAAPTADEVALRDHVAARGLVVEVLADTAATGTAVADAGAVVVTASARPWLLDTGLRNSDVALLTYKPWAHRELRLSHGNGGVRWTTTLDVVAPSHPLAAGRAGTVTPYDANGGNVPTVTPAGGTVVATATDGSPVVVAWEQGEAMATGVAPGCRATLAAYRGTVQELSFDGAALLDAALDWAVACSPGAAQLPSAGLVVRDATALNAGEAHLRDLLQGAGHAVVEIDDDGLVTASLEAHDVVVVANNVDTERTRIALEATTTPVVLHKPHLADDLNLATTNGTVRTTTDVQVDQPGHPVAAGLPAVLPLYADGAGPAPLLLPGTTVGTVVASADGYPAVVVATIGTPGANGSPLQGCRAFGPFWNNDVRRLSADATTLFVDLVAWATACGGA